MCLFAIDSEIDNNSKNDKNYNTITLNTKTFNLVILSLFGLKTTKNA